MVLAGCSVDRGGGYAGPTGYGPTGATLAPITEARPSPPPLDMMGTWRLAAPNGSACTIHFAGGQSADGTIRPEGGCPGDFYTSRRWSYESGALVLKDHNQTELARLRMAGPNQFEGQAANGELLTLTR